MDGGSIVTNKMTLDEFIKVEMGHLRFLQFRNPFELGQADILKKLKQHRPAFEAGMRPVLRFARSCVHPDVYHLLQNDGDHAMWREFVDRDDCIEFANKLGLEAEFTEDTHE